MKRFLRYLAIALLLPAQVAAQDDDGTFLERLLERSLGGEGRDVRVTGFRGALSSTATIERMTFADPAGIWLTLESVTLDWNRLALLRGRLNVNTLEARSIVLARLPQESTAGPALRPEASGFQLPELPVAVRIGALASPSITFGEPVFGIESRFSLEGQVTLEGGEGAGTLEVDRIDGPEGRFHVDAAFSNTTEVLALSLALEEAPGGILATLAGIPGEPSVGLSVEGQGPLSNFEATLALATAGEDRLTGILSLGGEGVGPGDPRPFRAEIEGDIAPLFAPAYGEFFGDRITLVAGGVRGADGALDLDTFRLDARTITLDGTLATGPDGRPRRFRLDGRIADDDGGAVLLPLPGAPTRVDVLTLDAAFDAGADDAWSGRFRIAGLDRPGFSAAEVILDGGGNILGLGTDARNGFTANVDFAAEALDLGDPAAGAALGEQVTGRIELTRFEGEPLRIRRFDIAGETYAFDASGTIDIADRDLAADGRAQVDVRDLSAFSGLAGRPLAGAATLSLAGRGALIGGGFDATVEGRTVDLSIAEPRVDAIVRGITDLRIDAARDLDGITLRAFRLASPHAAVTAEGAIRSDATRLALLATLEDAALVVPDLDGRHSLTLDTQANGALWDIRAILTGQTVSGGVTGALDLSDPVAAFDGTATLDAASLAPIARLADQPGLAGALSLGFDGTVTADLSRFDMRLTAREDGLRTGRPDLDRLLSGGMSLTLDAVRDRGGPVTLREVTLQSPALGASVTGVVSGLPDALTAIDAGVIETGVFEGRLSLDARDLSPLGPLAGLPGLSGAMEASVAGALAFDLTRFDLRVDAREDRLRTGRDGLDALVGGGLSLGLAARRDDGGPVTLASLDVTTPSLSLSSEGVLSGLPRALVPFPPDLAEAAEFDGSVTLSARDLAPLRRLSGLPGLGGALEARLQGRLAADLDTFDLRLAADGTGFRTGIAEADAYLAGATELRLDVARAAGELIIRDGRFTAPGLTAGVAGTANAAGDDFTATVRLDDIGRIVEGFSGPAGARVRVTAVAGGPWRVDGTLDGPAGTTFRTTGTVVRSFDTVDLAVAGTAPLGLANPFLQPLSIDGTATIDLRVSGPPALSSVSGRIATTGARFVAPTLGIVLEQMAVTVALAGGSAQIDARAGVQGGGSVTVGGPVTLAPPFPADLRVTLANARLRDPALYDTSLNGSLTVQGPLAGGAGIAGAVALGVTELRIPSGVTGGAVPIPRIEHIAEPRAVRLTRLRAGLIDEEVDGEVAAGRRVAYGLDIRVDAPNRIFVRGRGLDAELGGSLRIGGTTANIVPAGQFELVRGRLDILARRLVLDRGSITLLGDFDAFVSLSASTRSDDFVVSVILEGLLSDPEVRFESIPELPQDEVVARLLFGRGLDTISPFQAAQLAASVATLSGGANGVLGSLRDGFGIDNLDLTTDAAGQAQLTLGTYISDNLYSDLVISDGRTEIQINLDLTPSITLRGATADDGTSSIGIRFERDY